MTKNDRAIHDIALGVIMPFNFNMNDFVWEVEKESVQFPFEFGSNVRVDTWRVKGLTIAVDLYGHTSLVR